MSQDVSKLPPQNSSRRILEKIQVCWRLTCCRKLKSAILRRLCGESSSKTVPTTRHPRPGTRVPSRPNAGKRASQQLETVTESHICAAAPATPDEFRTTEEQKWAVYYAHLQHGEHNKIKALVLIPLSFRVVCYTAIKLWEQLLSLQQKGLPAWSSIQSKWMHLSLFSPATATAFSSTSLVTLLSHWAMLKERISWKSKRIEAKQVADVKCPPLGRQKWYRRVSWMQRPGNTGCEHVESFWKGDLEKACDKGDNWRKENPSMRGMRWAPHCFPHKALCTFPRQAPPCSPDSPWLHHSGWVVPSASSRTPAKSLLL